jgi:hypothetical protein
MQRLFIITSFIVLALVLVSCSGPQGLIPTLVPTSEGGLAGGDGSSPRNGGQGGLPATWTPAPTDVPITPFPTPTPLPAPGEPGSNTYVVQPGDTLAEIAAQFGVDLQRLAQENDIIDIDRIEVGQVLSIPR